MLFSDMPFLLFFLPVFLLATYAFRRNLAVRNVLLLIFSLFFYAWGDPLYLLLLLLSIVCNWVFALSLGATNGGYRKTVFIVSLLFNIGMLGVYKYAGFFVENVNAIFGTAIPDPGLTLPIGISFYTFQILSYVIDVYRREVPPQKNMVYLGAYLAAFPQLIAGPVVRYQTVMEELQERSVSMEDLADGFRRFMLGLGKKVIISNNVAYIVDTLIDGNFAMTDLGAAGAWLTVVAYTLQIYYDFSGYSDMAIGLGRMIGFHYLENFNHPYIAVGATDFWRRWHISLSTFFRDYIYIPMGGNRVSIPRWILNVMVVWMLTGLWHGASWNFVIWGLYFGVLLVLEKYPLRKLKDIPVLNHIYGLLVIMFGWAIFRCDDFGKLGSLLSGMLGLNGGGSSTMLYNSGVIQPIYLTALLLGILGCIPLVYQTIPNKLRKTNAGAVVLDIGYIVVLIISLLMLSEGSYNPFIYFRF